MAVRQDPEADVDPLVVVILGDPVEHVAARDLAFEQVYVVLEQLVARRAEQPPGRAHTRGPADLREQGVGAAIVAFAAVDAGEQQARADRTHPLRGLGAARPFDQVAHRAAAAGRGDQLVPAVAQFGDGRDVLAADRARHARQPGQLAPRAREIARHHLHFGDFEPRGEVAMVFLRDAGLERVEDLERRAARLAVEPDVAGEPGVGAVKVRNRLGKAPGLIAVAADRGPHRDMRVGIVSVEEQCLGQRQGGVGILVGRAAAGEAGGEAVAEVLDPDAGDDDRRLIVLPLRKCGRSRGEQGKQHDSAHRFSPTG